MRNILYSAAVLLIIYACSEIAGRDTPAGHESSQGYQLVNEPGAQPPEELRVGREEAESMRGRRGNDNASVKIAVKDLQDLIQGVPTATDSFVFFFVRYDVKSKKDRERYLRKRPRADWNEVGRKPSTVLVGFVGGDGPGTNSGSNTQSLLRPKGPKTVPIYDIGVVCPPPANCGCEIQH